MRFARVCALLQRRGAGVREVSLPLFRDGEAIWAGVGLHSVPAMIESDQEGYWRGGYCNVAWQAAFGKARRARANDFFAHGQISVAVWHVCQGGVHEHLFLQGSEPEDGAA